MITEKKCLKCGETKDVSYFYKQKSMKDGLNPYCKECFNNMVKYSRHKIKDGGGLNLNKKAEDANNPLADFTPRQLMIELRRRGYEGELTIVHHIDIGKI
jgi:hypothetical protein